MFLVVGLGNPGKEHEETRHNIGFQAADELIHRFAFTGPKKKFQGQLYEGSIGGHKLLVLKPQTYMNLSGQSVQAVMTFYKIPPEQVIVLHDELDLALGKIKTKQGGGHAGHNGLRDIIARVGKTFWRVRMGISHPGDKDLVTSYVLSKFTKDESIMVEKIVDHAADAVTSLLLDDPS